MSTKQSLILLCFSLVFVVAITLFDKSQSKHLVPLGERFEQSDSKPFDWRGAGYRYVLLNGYRVELTPEFPIQLFEQVGDLGALKKGLDIEQRIFDQALNPLVLIDGVGNEVALEVIPLQWGNLTLSFWGHRLVALLCIICGFFCFYTNSLVQSSALFSQGRITAGIMLFSMGIFVVLSPSSIDRQWVLNTYQLWSRYVGTLVLATIYVGALMVILIKHPFDLTKRHNLFVKLWWVFTAYFSFSVLLMSFQVNNFSLVILKAAYFVMSMITICLLGLQYVFLRRIKAGIVDRLALRKAIHVNVFIAIVYSLYNYWVQYGSPSIEVNPNLLNCLMSYAVSMSLLVLVFRDRLYHFSQFSWLYYLASACFAIFLITFMALSELGGRYELVDFLKSLTLAAFTAVFGIFVVLRMQSAQLSKALIEQARRVSDIDLSSLDQKNLGKLAELFKDHVYADDVNISDQDVSNIEIAQGGELLRVPLKQNLSLVLSRTTKGRRLFNRNDTERAQVIRDLAMQKHFRRHAYLQGQSLIRRHIAHDLHDNIGARLHRLAYGSCGSSKRYAQNTLDHLNSITHTLKDDLVRIDTWIQKTCDQFRGHCEAYNKFAKTKVIADNSLLDQYVSTLPLSQLTSIVQELCHNAVQHQGVNVVELDIDIGSSQTQLSVINDGHKTDVNGWISGLGLASTKRRAQELGGSIHWRALKTGGTEAILCVPNERWKRH